MQLIVIKIYIIFTFQPVELIFLIYMESFLCELFIRLKVNYDYLMRVLSFTHLDQFCDYVMYTIA